MNKAEGSPVERLVKISWGDIVLKPISIYTKSKLDVSHHKSYVQIK